MFVSFTARTKYAPGSKTSMQACLWLAPPRAGLLPLLRLLPAGGLVRESHLVALAGAFAEVESAVHRRSERPSDELSVPVLVELCHGAASVAAPHFPAASFGCCRVGERAVPLIAR